MSDNAEWAGATPELAASGSSLIARVLKRRLAGAEIGSIVVVLPSGQRIAHRGSKPGPHAEVDVTAWRTLRRLGVGGATGFAEAYIHGEWTSPCLPTFLEWATHNTWHLDAAFSGSRFMAFARRLGHLARANTRRGSRRNISAHYDLGNDFYALWLDRGMSYSSALYQHSGQTLEAAQDAKIARAAELLAPQADHEVLEIGCGWGAVAEHLIARHGCKVRGLTLSSEQKALAERRLQTAGARGRADIRLQDYRDERVTYDRIISIEMLEAVGEAYWPQFFAGLRDHLKPGGVAVLQSISIAADRYEAYRGGADFIQTYIFPGGLLPTVEIIRKQVEAAGLKLTAHEMFGQSYAATLAEWRRRFHETWPRARSLGFDERFKRTWDYYLAYCEAGFRAGALDVGLYKIERA
jgi:cyclopropane-fatty-acyl-phospholipid synthase